MRRIISLVVVALVMATMLLAMALPAFAQGGAAANCGPPGQTINEAAKLPGQSTTETWQQLPGAQKSPGQDVVTDYAPGHQEDEPPI
jgi:hypothetical protein